MLGDGCGIYFDSYLKGDRKYAYVDVVDDTQRVACIVIWWEGKVDFVLGDDWLEVLCLKVGRRLNGSVEP